MGNQVSDQMEVQPANAKLENGAANGHVSIPSTDEGENVACEVAVEQSSELPSPPTKEASPPSGNEVDGDKKHTKGTPAAPEPVVLLSFSKTEPPSTDAPEDPSQQSVSINASVEEEASPQGLDLKTETPTELDSSSKEEESKQKGAKRAKFLKVFKKKNKGEVEKELTLECNSPPEDQEPSVEAEVLTNGLHSEPGAVEGTTAAEKPSEGPSTNGTPAGGEALEVNGETVQQADTKEQEVPAEDKRVMNFFKTLVAPSKAPKEEGAPPAVPVEEVKVSEEPEPKAQAEASPVTEPADTSMAEPKAPAPSVKVSVPSPFSKFFKSKQPSKGDKPETTTKAVLEVDASMASTASKPPPPPPPPEPPKLEVKAELAIPAINSAQTEAPKDAAKEPEAASKQKPAKGSPFRKLFHSKAKSADVRVSPGPSPKAEKKSGKSNLIAFFKPTTPDTKAKEGASVAAPAVTVDAAQAAAVKAEPKPAAEAEKKPEATPADGKPVSQASQSGEDGTSGPSKKMEKRNSVHTFFKILAQKRQSDTGVQTDPVTIVYPTK
ncbi:breast carcinoma-amplified sequence 1 isoform X3 [Anguilla anguilla]|uniref:breast carcinoma-amplified sequence 1 isoform X3 n=1 Tax=Anguilla anguilla TaxID=7936 RepID=UPI0015AA8A48|nr:breast carcinoma-amplified sequence 1 isoform X3 [Anguilla anguilla]